MAWGGGGMGRPPAGVNRLTEPVCTGGPA
ncbi:hypothetical protein GA0115259_1030711, partial [Streptomyces sp. MnatMP-M17]